MVLTTLRRCPDEHREFRPSVGVYKCHYCAIDRRSHFWLRPIRHARHYGTLLAVPNINRRRLYAGLSSSGRAAFMAAAVAAVE